MQYNALLCPKKAQKFWEKAKNASEKELKAEKVKKPESRIITGFTKNFL